MSHPFATEEEFFSKHFKNMVLKDETVASAVFEECEFRDCNFSGTSFSKCKFSDCSFVNCNLSNLGLAETKIFNVEFSECKAMGLDWSKAKWPRFTVPPQIKFQKSIISESSFFGLHLEELVIEDCKAHSVDFRDGNFTRSNFSHSDFAHSFFGKTILVEVDFTEAFNYDIDILDNNIERAKFSRHEAVNLLNRLGIELVD
jgi:fluoroquinolone resistance protein